MPLSPMAFTDRELARFRRELEAALAKTEREIRRALAAAKVGDDGRLVADAQTLEILRRSGEEIADILDGAGSKVADRFRATVDELVRRVGASLDAAGVVPAFVTPSTSSLRMQAGGELDALIRDATKELRRSGDAVERRLRAAVTQMMRSPVTPEAAQSRLADAVGASVLRSLATVDVALAGTNRAVTLDVAAQGGIEWFLYDGPVDSLTRDDCRAWAGHRFTRAQMDRLKSKVGPQPVSLFGGGYGCRHEWVPLVEPEDVRRYPRWQG